MGMDYKDNKKGQMKGFYQSFKYAFEGLLYAFRAERNLKIDLVISLFVIALGIWLKISLFEWLCIMIAIGGVISLELMNTALERVIDLVTEDFHPLAKKGKDIAASAVLFFAIIAAIIGLMIFVPKIWEMMIFFSCFEIIRFPFPF